MLFSARRSYRSQQYQEFLRPVVKLRAYHTKAQLKSSLPVLLRKIIWRCVAISEIAKLNDGYRI